MISKNTRMNIAWLILILTGLASVSLGFYDAIAKNGSWDMQWSPSVLLSLGINPYQWWLEGNKAKIIMLHQQPNYLHALYIIMLPLTKLDWYTAKIVWALMNTMFGISIAWYLSTKASFTTKSKLITVLLFICSTSFQNTLASGQLSLFILFFSMMAIYSRTNIQYILNASLAIIKYSFAPPLILYEYYQNGCIRILGITIFSIISIFLFSIMVDQSPLKLAASPFVISQHTAIGQADLMSLCNLFLPQKLCHLSYFFSFIYIGYSVHIYHKTNIHRWLMLDFAYLSLISLTAFRHLNYDFIFLLPLLICAARFTKLHRVIIYSIIFWFWFGSKILFYTINNAHIWIYVIPIQFLLLLTCIVIVKSYSQHAFSSYTPNPTLLQPSLHPSV